MFDDVSWLLVRASCGVVVEDASALSVEDRALLFFGAGMPVGGHGGRRVVSHWKAA